MSTWQVTPTAAILSALGLLFRYLWVMAQQVKNDVLSAVLDWPAVPPLNKVDTHHHFVPDFYAKGVLC